MFCWGGEGLGLLRGSLGRLRRAGHCFASLFGPALPELPVGRPVCLVWRYLRRQATNSILPRTNHTDLPIILRNSSSPVSAPFPRPSEGFTRRASSRLFGSTSSPAALILASASACKSSSGARTRALPSPDSVSLTPRSSGSSRSTLAAARRRSLTWAGTRRRRSLRRRPRRSSSSRTIARTRSRTSTSSTRSPFPTDRRPYSARGRTRRPSTVRRRSSPPSEGATSSPASSTRRSQARLGSRSFGGGSRRPSRSSAATLQEHRTTRRLSKFQSRRLTASPSASSPASTSGRTMLVI